MALTSSSSGGGDNLQVGIAVFCIVISLATAMMVPVFAPGYDTGYSYNDIYQERMELEAFTGESMTSQSPWMLTGVYEAYVQGGELNIDDETGWIYGKEITDYPYVNESTAIRLDPNQKSSMTFDQADIQYKDPEYKFHYADNAGGDIVYGIVSGLAHGVNWIANKLGQDDVWAEPERLKDDGIAQTWTYTGYRYEFDPMMTIQKNEDGSDKTSSVDAQLSIIWYDVNGNEGLSGGLILYDDMSEGIVANYSAVDIVSNYNIGSSFATKYTFNFDGQKISMHILFDSDVFLDGTDLGDAWSEGRWTVAFTATTADDLFNIEDSNTLSSSIGNIIQTYSDIFTFDLPNVPTEWSMVLWILCILPAEIAVLMFLSRFGPLGLLAGVLGNIFLGVL